MSGAWGAMVTANAQQLRADHGLVEATHESAAWQAARNNYGESFKQGFRGGWWQAVEWVLEAQARWNTLSGDEALAEYDKGSGSIFYPLWAYSAGNNDMETE